MCVAVACLAAVSYASKTHGKHHACGHDGHMASLLAVAKIVAGMARRLKGIVKFIFQVPASIPMRAHIPSTCVCAGCAARVPCAFAPHHRPSTVLMHGRCAIAACRMSASCDVVQPAEEGGAGAQVMVQEGALLSPDVDEIYGLHLYNYHDLGYVGVKHGPIMASGCRFKIDVIGKGASWWR